MNNLDKKFNSIRVRGIVQYENHSLILMRRIKFINNSKNEYYTFPGGKLENNETILECLKREIFEEIGIEINIIKKLYTLKLDDYQIFILCKYRNGIIGSGNGEEFSSYKSNSGLHIPALVKFDDLSKLTIFPEEISNNLIFDFGIA